MRRFRQSIWPWMGTLAGLVPLLAGPAHGTDENPPGAALEQAISQAEKSLQEARWPEAEGRYQAALGEGWLLLGTLERLAGQAPEARSALAKALAAVPGNRAVRAETALTEVQFGEVTGAEKILKQLLLEDPEDLEATFAMGRAQLALGKPARAAPYFAKLVAERPIPQTHLLLGRTYRDFGLHDLSRAEWRAVLTLDAKAPRAHYELGMTALAQSGRAGMEEAIGEFQAELERAPEDPRASLELGVALVETQRFAEALPRLDAALRLGATDPRVVAFRGRALLGVGRAPEAVDALRLALEQGGQHGANAAAVRAMQLQLGQALRATGRTEEAAAAFAEAERLSEENTAHEREQMARYQADPDAPASTPGTPARLELSPLAALPPGARTALRQRVEAALAGAYLNLGILKAQAGAFEPAAALLEQAASLAPELPQVQPSLAIAYFNSRQFDKAIPPLLKARAASPGDPGLRRMLALARLNTRAFAEATALLRDDPDRPSDASLQFAYAAALIKGGHAAEADPVLEALRANGASPELSVLIGQSHAQQGHVESAIAALKDALAARPDVPEANATLGLVYLRAGRVAEAIAELETAVRLAPDDASLRAPLAQAYQQSGRKPRS
jgi:tetratricopeptide (TPR) repeat protein